MNDNGLYSCILEKEYVNKVPAVKENVEGYTKRQVERAKQARKLYHVIGTPTVDNFKSIIKMNSIMNCPVTSKDVILAEKIFGPDISSLKGKSTRTRPNPVSNDEIEIPTKIYEEHSNLELCMDIMFVNGQPMLTTIDRSIKFRGLVRLNNRKKKKCIVDSIYY